MSSRILKHCGIMFGIFGFYRGWNADYHYSRYTDRITPRTYGLSSEKYMEKFMRGSFNAVFYCSFGFPLHLYHFLCRTEILLTGKDPYHYVFAYVEMGDYTTLSPRKT